MTSETGPRGNERALDDGARDGSWANGGNMVTDHPHAPRVRDITQHVAGWDEFELCGICGLAPSAHTEPFPF